jgi:hypothetical protein
MAGEGRGISLSRRAVAFGLAALPLVGCAPVGPDRDVPFIPANKAAALKPGHKRPLPQDEGFDETYATDEPSRKAARL